MQITIQNRHKLDISLDYIEAAETKGLAFIQHGLGGFKDQPHMLAIADVFKTHNISTVNFDASHSIGESGGNLIHATLTNHFHDLVDVIAWARTQPWFQSPFYLAGHSMGGASILHYTLNNPQNVKAVAPLSSVMSGLSWRATKSEAELKTWQVQGYYEKTSSSKPGIISKVGWDLMEDAMRYDVSIGLNTLSMPALFIVGSEDDSTPPAYQQIMYNNWGGPKEYHEIEGCGHTFKSPLELTRVKTIIQGWLTHIAYGA